MFKKLLVIFMLLIIIHITAFGQCKVPPIPGSPSSPGSPGGDACDENYSYSSGNVEQLYFITPGAIIFTNGYFQIYKTNNQIQQNIALTDLKDSPENLINAGNFIILPTGSLFGIENDSTLKAVLQEYVRLGGTIIVFAQQFGSHIDNVVPIPQGESLKSYGWREDQSCWSYSYNLKAMHPALAAMVAGSIVVDGQFSIYPSDSTILLRKGSNQEPVLLYYPYGNGTVILTSLYTDWGAMHSQTTASELRLVRDLVTFAKNPKLAIPMYDLTANPTPSISLQVKVKNDSEYAASKAKMTVYTPDRKTVLYQAEAAVSLAAGTETEIPLAFTLPEFTDLNLGICHTDYELYDAENNLVQMATEADSGRFTPYRLKLAQAPSKDLACWLTTNNEYVYWDENPHFTLHVRNNTDHEITESFFYDWWHVNRTFLASLTIAAGQTHDYNFEIPLLTNIHNWYDHMESLLLYRNNSGTIVAYKGIRVVYPSFSAKIQTPSSQIRFGDAIGFSINSANTTGKAISGEMTLKLFDGNNEIQTLFSQAHNFGKDETFTYSGSQLLVSPIAPEAYTLQLGVKRPDGKTQYSYTYFYYVRSTVSLILDRIPQAYEDNTTYPHRFGLTPGQTYSVNFKLGNGSKFTINQGHYVVTLKSEDGIEIFRKEATNIVLNASQWLTFSEPFVFSPTRGGKFTLKVEYTDESRTPEMVTVAEGKYEYLLRAEMTSDKTRYCYLDNANVQLKVKAVGPLHIKFENYETGESQEKDIDIPVGQTATELYSVPISLWMFSYYNVGAKITDSFGNTVIAGAEFLTTKPIIEHSSRTDGIGLKEGLPLNLTLTLAEKSGMTAPCPAVLTVASAGLNFSETRNVTLQPAAANEFVFQIPVAEAAAEGLHAISYQLKIGELVMAQGRAMVELQPITMKFSEPPASINAGASFDLHMENSGGRPGTFALNIGLRDASGQQLLKHEETLTLAVGEKKIVNLTLPEGLKSGKYILLQNATHAASGQVFKASSGITLSGLTATLNAFTLKPAYFDNETVAGKAEIVAGGAIANGILKAKIFKTKRGGITVYKPSQYASYQEAPVTAGKSFGSKTYLVTDMGLVEYDRSTGKYAKILDKKGLSTIYITATGELWLSTMDWNYYEGSGVMHRDLAGVWTTYISANGLVNDTVWDFIEYENNGQKAIWMATESGIAVFSNNAWSSYTTADGLSSNYIYQFAKDSHGNIWVSTDSGIDRFNGTAFEKVDIPNAPSVGAGITAAANGDIWLLFSICSSEPGTSQCKVYRYSQDTWTNWDILANFPGVFLWNLKEDDGIVWFTGDKYSSESSFEFVGTVVAKYDGEFTVYCSTDIPNIANVYSIIPVPGQVELYFGYYSNDAGFVEFNGDMWQKRFIEIEDDYEGLLVNDAYLMAEDNQGGVWIAGNTGVAHFNDGDFTNYSSGDAESPLRVDSLAVDPAGSAYALNYVEGSNNAGESYILKITDEGNTSIPFPVEFNSHYNKPVLGVDSNGRLWLGENPCPEGCMYGSVYYYDGAWHAIGSLAWVNKIISDGAGGVWIACGSVYSTGGLIHVLNDLSIQNFTSIETELAYGSVEDIYRDSSGILWVLSKKRTEYYGDLYPEVFNDYEAEAVQTLENNVFTLKAISASSEEKTLGYPAGGIWGIAEAGAGNVVFAGKDSTDGNAFHLYWLNGQEMLADENIFYSPYAYGSSSFDGDYPHVQHIIGSNGMIYAIGDILNSEEHDLLQIGGGMGKETVWSNEYAVDENAGATLNLDLLPAKTLAAGNYILSAELASALGQNLATSNYGFIVRGSAVGASISRSGSADVNVRVGSDATLQLEVLNNTAEDKAGLNLKVSKVSPSGVETVLQDGALSLNAGQSHTENLTFNESESGYWKLAVAVSESGTLLSSAELLLDVSAPAIAYEITHPEYAGDEAFPVKIKLTNTGKLIANMHVSAAATGGSPSYLNEDVTLAVGEERILSFNDTISTDRAYDIAFSGDLAASEQRSVKYGYVGNLALTVLPQYREGSVNMGYTVANGGGLPFNDTFHFTLYLLGTETAIYTVDKTYNLYPSAEASADSLEFPLAPGAYQLRWSSGHSGSGQADLSILPAGIGQLAFAPAAKYPVGLADFSYTLTNSDTVAGSIPLLIEIVPAAGGTAVLTLNRNYYLESGASISDTFSNDFTGIGSYIVRISGAKIAGGTINAPLKVLNLDEVTTSVAVQPASGGAIPVLVNISNSGYNDFAGTLVIEAGGLRHEEQLQVVSEATLNQTFTFDANGLSSGSQDVIAYIYDAAGNVLSQNTLTVAVINADIKISDIPQNLTIAAGSFANVALKVRNEGNKRGEAEITMTAFDTLKETRTLVLEAGEELELSDVYIDVDGDIPAGRYPFNYTLSGLGVTNGLAKGNFNFQVTGIALNVSAALDRSLYNQGETALLTLSVSSTDPVTTPLEAVVNWNDFSERRAFTLDNGSASLVFEIPLAEAGAAKVFYGIYQQEGRGIYLNDIYLNFTGNVSVTLDQQVYAPGDSIHALFTVGEPGSLTVECFGQSQTVAIGSSSSIAFAVPAEALGGSYGVAWTFTPADTAHEPSSGSKAFDVSGLVVKVAKAELERGKYAPGDTIKAMLSLESNRDIALSLRSWTTTPEAQWTYLGEQSVSLSATQQTPAVLQYTFATTEAGTHRFVYGLYREEQLVVSGAAAFDCGDAVLLGLAADHLEYPDGNETVKVKVDYFGAGTASLQLYLDDVVVDTKSITLAGLGSTEIDLTAVQVSGGRHDLRAVISKDGLTSTRRAWFTYGTNLPDLAVGMAERSVNGLEYVFTIQVSNNGKTAAPATTLIFTDNNSDVQSAAIPSLAPGEYQNAQFTWSGSGKAGSHNLSFIVDRDNAIKEFAEANNVLETTEEVPALFYKLEIDPQVWTANRSVSIFSRLINNQATTLPLLLHLTLTHNASSQIILDRNKNISLVPFIQAVETDVFNTGTYPAGDYTLRQTASGDAIERTEELAVYIEPTKIISGTMTAVPATVAAGIDTQVTLKLALSNGGNVALESEPLTVEVAGKESQEVVKTDALTVSLALGETKTIDHVLALNLAEGVYTVTLRYLENTVAQVEITALKGLDKEKYVSRRPRLLIMNLLQLLYLNQKNYLKSILSAAGIMFQDTANLIESYFHHQKSEYNVNVVFGNLLAPNLKKELKERVNRGEGLIYIADNAVSDGVLEELSGVKVRNLALTLREKGITLLPGPLGNGGAALLKNNCKFWLDALADDIQVLAETKNGKKPIMTYRQFGRGKVLTFCAPLDFASGGGVFAQLLLNAVTLLNNETFSPSDLTRVMPMELRIKNNTGAAKTFRVQELVPQAATAYGFNPQPLAGDGIKWDITLAVNEEKVISYWLRLPDTVGTYDIKSEIYEGEQKIDEALLTFEVGQKVSDRVVALAAEISAGGDAQAQLALPLLQGIAGRTGTDALSLWLNLIDAVQATDLVAASDTGEAALWRQKLQNVIMACARVFYDKVKDFTPFELSAFGTRFQE